MVRATTKYIAAAANRYTHAATTIPDSSLVAFGSSRLIALWNTLEASGQGIYQTLPGHEANVTCVLFLSSGNALATADEAGWLRLWQKVDQWSQCFKIEAHVRGVSALAAHDHILVSGSSDALLKIWNIVHTPDPALELVQTIDMNGRFPLDITLSPLPGTSSLIMALSRTDSNIQIYTRSDEKFIHCLTLPGHEDWVKALSFSGIQGQCLTLASGSQDNTIRLWVISPIARSVNLQSREESSSDELLDRFEASLGELDDPDAEGGKQISMKRHLISVKHAAGKSVQFSLTFDALLLGHEAGVTSLSWRGSSSSSIATLLSTSTDSSVILWSPSGPSEDSQLWVIRQRFGDVGGQRLGGFLGGFWGSYDDVVAWGWNGGWRRWRNRVMDEQKREAWIEIASVSGHSGPVRSVAWDPNADYLISAGLDQTTRIHGPWRPGKNETWHEISRPQIHGYDLLAAIFLSPLRMVSIADEKVARVFDAPAGFVKILNGLGLHDRNLEEGDRPQGATLPPLGLSNKATTGNTELSASIGPPEWKRPPLEGELAASTLWPEVEKLFGHGYELISLAKSHSGSLVATACKSTTAVHAVIRIHDTTKWQPVGKPLEGHTLTVTRIAFSPDDKYILTVSRDRTWRLFELQDGGYTPLASEKAHARIIWDCAWAHEGDIFATAARDKTVKIWHRKGEAWVAICTLKIQQAATSVAFSSVDDYDGCRRMAVGLENGEIIVYSSKRGTPQQWNVDLSMDSQTAHIDHVYRVSWRPIPRTSSNLADGEDQLKRGFSRDLASCSDDGSLRVLTLSWP